MKKLMQAKVICPVLLVLVMAGHVAADFAWQRENVAPYWWDQASYLVLSEWMRAAFEQGGIQGFWDAFLTRDGNRAPLVSALYAATYALAGDSRESAHIVNYLAIAVLCLFLYGIGKRLAGPWCGLAAAYITMAAPMMFGLSRQLLVEFPLTAAAAAVAYLCIVSNGLHRYGICVLLGAAIGIGMMVKITFPAFVVGPLLVAVVARGLHQKKKEAGGPIGRLPLNLGIVLVIAALISGPWLLHNMDSWTRYMQANVVGYLAVIYGGSNIYYIEMVALQNLLCVYVFMVTILATLRLIFRRDPSASVDQTVSNPVERRVALLTTLSWFFIPLGIGLYSLNKDPRLIAPAFAALGVLLAYVLVRLTPRRAAPVAVGLLLLVMVPFYNVSFGTPFDSAKYNETSTPFTLKECLLGRWSTGFTTSPVKEDWKGEEVVSFIETQIPEQFIKDNQVATIVVMGSHPWFQASWLSYLQWHRNIARGQYATRIEYTGDMPPLQEEPTPERCAEVVLQGHFVIMKDSGWQGGEYQTRQFDALAYAVRETKTMYLGRELRLFEKIDCDITLPDGSKVVVYRQQGMMFRATAEQRDEFWTLRAKFIEMARSYRKP